MKNSLMYGAGNIGRGFIGALFAQSGYAVTFVDVAQAVVDRLNAEHSYPVRIIDGDSFEDLEITHVNAIDGRDVEAVAEAIARADIMATAVGVNILPRIVPMLVAGLRRRFATSTQPLNIIICENLMNADKLLAGLIKDQLEPFEQLLFEERVGLVEASIGRMVPVQTPAMQDGEPLRVCVERYGFLPVDQAAFKGAIPAIKNLVPYAPFDFYLKRKLYLHNMGHAVCAYLGGFQGNSLIAEAIDDANILVIVQNAMLESARALSAAYDMPLEGIIRHTDDLLHRFANAALQDTCTRVGADPRRKLSPEDRLVGAARLCLQQGQMPVCIAVGIAGAVYRYLVENSLPLNHLQAEATLGELSGLDAADELTGLVLQLFELLRHGCSVADLRRAAAELSAKRRVGVI